MSLCGHDAAWREWRAALGSERMHHAWICAGLRGLGKGNFARAAAAELVAEPGVPQPDPAKHPDIIVIEPLPASETDVEKRAEGKPYVLKRGIAVDQIRAMRRRLETRPTLGSRRVVIVDPVDVLERSAANALLKNLEEPPEGTFFVLVSHRPGQLLPTVRSRCSILRFARLSDAQVAEILAAAPADAATRAAAVAAAEGSPGAALGFVEQDLGKLHGIMLRLLDQGDESFVLRGALAEEIGGKPDRERQAATLDLARATLAGALRQAAPFGQRRVIEAHAALVRLAAQAPTYNFDAGLLAMEIGGLLASAAVPKAA